MVAILVAVLYFKVSEVKTNFGLTSFTSWLKTANLVAAADYDKYVVINGVRVRRGSETKNWWGPVSAGVTLVWNIF